MGTPMYGNLKQTLTSILLTSNVPLLPKISSHFFFFFLAFCLFWAAPAAYGGFQARGGIGAAAAGLWQNHSNKGSEPSL